MSRLKMNRRNWPLLLQRCMIAFFAALLLFTVRDAQAAATIYPAPSNGVTASSKYAVTIDNANCFVYQFDNYDNAFPAHHLTYFAMSGSVTVRVRKLAGNINSIKIRPSNWGISATVSGDTATFTLASPRNLSVELDGDTRTPLYLFANAPETNAPSPGDSTVTYFGPGYTDATNISPKSKVYLAGGAVVAGLRMGGGTPTVWGHGILCGINSTQKQSGFYIGEQSVNFKDFILVKTLPGWQMYLENCSGTINNVRILGANWVDDGMDLNRCHDLTIDGVFIKTQDDNIAIKNYKWDPNLNPEYFPGGDTKNIVVKNSTFYCGGANNLEIGHETVGGNIDNVQFINNDVMHGSGRNGHGSLSIHLVGDTNISNITYDNIRVEDLSVSSYLINVIIAENKYSFGRGRGTITGLTYKNINYLEGSSPLIYFQGADDSHKVKNVTFDNLKILGNTITSPSGARIRFPQYVENVKFSPSATTSYSSQPGWKILTHEEYMSMYDAIDNDMNTLWASDGKSTSSDWISLNLSSGAPYNGNAVSFNRVEVYGDRYANTAGLNIQVSNDGSNWTSVSVSNSVINDAEGYPITCVATFSTQNAKYVRISPTGDQPYNNNWHVFEIKVFNGNNAIDLSFPPVPSTSTPTPTPTPPATPLAAASSVENGNSNYSADKAFDGNYGTRWASQGINTEWIWRDMGSTQNVTRVKINWEFAYAKSYRVQLSSSSSGPWTDIYSTTNSDGSVDDLSGLSGSGRYLRILCEQRGTNYGYSIWEVEITTGGTSNNTPTLLSRNKTATASSYESSNSAYAPGQAFDGRLTTRWASNGTGNNEWLAVDLGSTRTITSVKLNWEAAYGRDYDIQVANNSSGPWTTMEQARSRGGGLDEFTGLSNSGRYVRMQGVTRGTSWGYSLWEFEVYGY